MKNLKPLTTKRLLLFDRLAPKTAENAQQAHLRYSDPATIEDLKSRLKNVARDQNPRSILTEQEWKTFSTNSTILDVLEINYFKRWHIKYTMDQLIKIQRVVTKSRSPLPSGQVYQALEDQVLNTLKLSILYGSWNQEIPINNKVKNGPETWGEVLLKFNSDPLFRKAWVSQHPETLPFLKKLMELWAWEDSAVKAITVFNQGLENEYWVLDRSQVKNPKSRFELSINSDVAGLISLEFEPSVFFNRLSRITKDGVATVYHLESIEKGRTMELAYDEGSNKFEKKLFPGSELLRKTKSDELAQRKYVGTSLSLFLGPRALQLDQIQKLTILNPELVAAVGQFGFSATGGQAQMISIRTDSPEEQLAKFTASMIDLIEFANSKDVEAWFKKHERYLKRVVSTGVGSGNISDTQKNPKARLVNKSKVLSCSKFF